MLRQFGWEGPIALVGAEPIAPYQRPPLSKAWLKGEADAEALMLKPESYYAEERIDLRLATAATAIDLATREVALEGGERLAFDALILATGARARALPIAGADLQGVLALRTAADAEALKHALGPGKRLAVIGGGYVGLEAAASARALGAAAVVIERESRVLARVACPALSDFFQTTHAHHGVVFELSAGVAALEGEGGHVTGVRLADGRLIACDVALVGVGALPDDGLARAAGIACDDGVLVDLSAKTSAEGVYAIGDCTRRPMPLYDRTLRLESVPNALEQARQAASHLTGRPAPAPETPWFWSDQYDLKLQIAGLPFDAVETLVRGDPATGRFAVFHLDAMNRLQAVEAINAPPEFMAGRQLIGARKPVDPKKLRDLSVSMKAVAAEPS